MVHPGRSPHLHFRVPSASAVLVSFLWIAALAPLAAFATQDKPQDVTELDLDQLVKVRVTSVGRKAQAMTDVPAAVYVIRQEDLKRTGSTNIAEALRAVPGLQVARPTAHTWAVSGRGFNSTSANKLLVMIDGRSVYSPLHSGVFWDVQDTFLEDIERIEVI